MCENEVSIEVFVVQGYIFFLFGWEVCKHEKINTRTYGGGEKYCVFISFDEVKGCNEKFLS